jgi:hypothetical protein
MLSINTIYTINIGAVIGTIIGVVVCLLCVAVYILGATSNNYLSLAIPIVPGVFAALSFGVFCYTNKILYNSYLS